MRPKTGDAFTICPNHCSGLGKLVREVSALVAPPCWTAAIGEDRSDIEFRFMLTGVAIKDEGEVRSDVWLKVLLMVVTLRLTVF